MYVAFWNIVNIRAPYLKRF